MEKEFRRAFSVTKLIFRQLETGRIMINTFGKLLRITDEIEIETIPEIAIFSRMFVDSRVIFYQFM